MPIADGLCALPISKYGDSPFWISSGGRCPNLVAFRNGLLDVEAVAKTLAAAMNGNVDCPMPDLSSCFFSKTPDFFDTSSIDYNFEQEAKCPMFEAFLEKIQPDPSVREIIQMMFGWAISGTSKYQIGFILVGEGGTGKSTLLEILVAIMGGWSNVANISYEKFAERFSLFPLTQHKLNVCNEMPEILGDNRENGRREAVFKSLCCGETYSVEEKGNPIVTRRFTARPIFATNRMPYISNKSNGIYRRMRLIPFSNVIGENEVKLDYHRRILDNGELPGIVLWALKGYAKLQKQGSFPKCAAGEALLDEYRKSFDPLGTFLKENLEEHFGKRVTKTELEERYRTENDEADDFKFKPSTIEKAMLQAFPSAKKQRIRKKNSHENAREDAWEGIRMRSIN